jgi:hypothetical protein
LKFLPPGDVAPATLQALRILVVVDYENCKAFGVAAVLHPFRYLIDANGLVTQENTTFLLAPVCKVTFPAGKNQSLTAALFHFHAVVGPLLVLLHLERITSSGEGAACTYAEESNGIWTGTWQIRVEGGTLRWDS